jgi:hypothetical protein
MTAKSISVVITGIEFRIEWYFGLQQVIENERAGLPGTSDHACFRFVRGLIGITVMLTIWTVIALLKVGHKIETVRSSCGQTLNLI